MSPDTVRTAMMAMISRYAEIRSDETRADERRDLGSAIAESERFLREEGASHVCH